MATARTTEPGDTVTGYESQLWSMADALRGSMDAAEYKHVVLGLIFLKYISDAFEEGLRPRCSKPSASKGADPEDPDEYLAQNIFLAAGRGPMAPPAGPRPPDPKSAGSSTTR